MPIAYNMILSLKKIFVDQNRAARLAELNSKIKLNKTYNHLIVAKLTRVQALTSCKNSFSNSLTLLINY